MSRCCPVSPHARTRLRSASAASVGVILALLTSGCGGTGRARHAVAANLQSVTEQDFAIRGPSRVRAGTVDLRVHNAGVTDTRADRPAPTTNGSLPLRADGLTIDEEAIESRGARLARAGQARGPSHADGRPSSPAATSSSATWRGTTWRGCTPRSWWTMFARRSARAPRPPT